LIESSVATHLKCGGSCNDKFSPDCDSEKKLKMGKYLTNL